MIPKVLGKLNAMPQKISPMGNPFQKAYLNPPAPSQTPTTCLSAGHGYNDSFENHINVPAPANGKELQDFFIKMNFQPEIQKGKDYNF